MNGLGFWGSYIELEIMIVIVDNRDNVVSVKMGHLSMGFICLW